MRFNFCVFTVCKAICETFNPTNISSKCCKIVKMDAEHRRQCPLPHFVTFVLDRGTNTDDTLLDIS